MADAELVKMIAGEMGKAAEPILARMTAAEEKTKKIEELIDGLRKSATTAPIADAYDAALRGGKPHAARANESAATFIERFIEEEGERAIVNAVRQRRGVARGHHIDPKGLDFIRTLRAMALAALRDGTISNGSGVAPPKHESVLRVFSEWGDKRGAGLVEEARDLYKRAGAPTEKPADHVRAQNSVLLGAGAGFVTTQMYAGFIDFRWPRTVVRALGAMQVPVSKNAIELLYIDSAAGASRRGQLSPAVETGVGEKRLLMTLKLLSSFIAASNELLAEADINLDVFYRAMLTRAIAQQENIDFLTGMGGQNVPRGHSWWVDNATNPMVPASHVFNRTLDTGAATFKTIRRDLLTLQQKPAERDVDLSIGSPGYAFHTAVKFSLMRVLNVNDVPVFGDEMRGGTLLGAAFADSTAGFATNEAGDGVGHGTGNKTRVKFGDWSTFAIAEDPNVELKVQDGGAYRDAGGNVVTGLTTNETVFVVHAKNDSGCLQRGNELSEVRSVDWYVPF
jgi:hypothetical protein